VTLLIAFCFAILIGTLVWAVSTLRTDRGDALGIPLVAIASSAVLYVWQPLAAMHSAAFESFITERMFAKALIIPALMLGSYMMGWRFAYRSRRPVSQSESWRPQQLWNFGLGTAAVGLCLYAVFIERSGGVRHAFSGMHGTAMEWESNTAYLYSGPWWIVSGTAMMLCASGRMRLTGWRRSATFLAIFTVFAKAVLTGSRGPLFTAASVIFVGYGLARGRNVSLPRAFAFVGAVGVAALLMLGFRGVLHLGDNPAEAPSLKKALTSITALEDNAQSTSSTGNEFIFHGATIETVDTKHRYHLGLNWIYVYTIHPIPRIFWPEKPYRFETPGIHWEDIQEVTHLTVLGPGMLHRDETIYSTGNPAGHGVAIGAYPGLVADMYGQFGLFSVLVFYLMGKYSRRLFVAASTLDSPLATCGYVLLYGLSLNGFAQELYAVLIPFTFAMAPVVLYTLLTPKRSQVRRPLGIHPLRFQTSQLAQESCSPKLPG
jgi:hypothetical protein